ncbi:antitoxin VbhA family protein [Streptomyces sp. NPDC057131]|uniref:antitoxin VbhA family protein n=1 Tax=Streptomyces sp. NPDC057131 TaxID=3346027 RepID=UPI0036D27B7B
MKSSKVKGIESVKASLAMEGLELTEEEVKLILYSVEGEISEEEFLEKVKELANG